MKPQTGLTEEEQHKADDDQLKRVIKWAVTVCIGAMAGFIVSVRQVNPSIEFAFDFLTFGAFVFGCGMGWLFWRVIPDTDAVRKPGVKKWIPLFVWMAVLLAMMVGGFVYSMKDISNAKQHEMYLGTGMAILVLSFVGFLFWRSVRYFENEHKRYLHEHHQHDE